MEKVISNIVFTRNRPLQLEAYLESMYQHIPKELIHTYILYKVDLFDEEYSEVFRRFPDTIVIRESNFHDDFLAIFDRLNTLYILFGTDDVVYYDTVNFDVIAATFETFGNDMFGFTLRLEPQSMKAKNEVVETLEVGGEQAYCINWKKAKMPNAKYPFELDSTIYRTSLVRRILTPVAKEHPVLKKIFTPKSLLLQTAGLFLRKKDFLASFETFRNPNTLEGYCYRWCRAHKRRLPSYLYFQKLCASAIQVNRVNKSTKNPIDGSNEHTVEALNEKYKQGYRFDVEAFEKDKPRATHIRHQYFRLVKR